LAYQFPFQGRPLEILSGKIWVSKIKILEFLEGLKEGSQDNNRYPSMDKTKIFFRNTQFKYQDSLQACLGEGIAVKTIISGSFTSFV